MIGGLGMGELLVVLVIVMVIFGAGRISEIGSGLGKGIRDFKKAVTEPQDSQAEKSEQIENKSSSGEK